jgi:hypothetical protein
VDIVDVLKKLKEKFMGFWEIVLTFVVAICVAPFVLPIIVTGFGFIFLMISAIIAAISRVCNVTVKRIHRFKRNIKEKYNARKKSKTL